MMQTAVRSTTRPTTPQPSLVLAGTRVPKVELKDGKNSGESAIGNRQSAIRKTMTTPMCSGMGKGIAGIGQNGRVSVHVVHSQLAAAQPVQVLSRSVNRWHSSRILFGRCRCQTIN